MHSRLSTPRPLDTLWQAGTIVWIILAGEALAVVLVLAPGGYGDWLTYFGMASFATQWVFLTSLGTLYLCRGWLGRASPPVIAQAGLAALLLSTWLVCGLAWLFLGDVGLTPAEGWLLFTLRLTGLALTVGLLALAAFQAQWRARQLALRAKQSELEVLQARIRPHFLFNTINTGIALVHARPDATERLLLDLSDLFRAAIAGPDEIPLQEELALARRYLEIEQLRFGSRLAVQWDIPAGIGDLPPISLPPLSIQPLVENAIKHGIEPRTDGGRVVVAMRSGSDSVAVIVRNPLPPEDSGRSAGHGIGLNAVAARIQASTGGGRLSTRVEDGEFVAELSMPVKH